MQLLRYFNYNSRFQEKWLDVIQGHTVCFRGCPVLKADTFSKVATFLRCSVDIHVEWVCLERGATSLVSL